MECKKSLMLIFALKVVLFLSLFIVFYVNYVQEVASKYANKTTWVSTTKQKLLEGVKQPLLTLCLAGPFAKNSVMKKYNMSFSALDEPSLREQKILKDLNKTLQEFYQEATFQLNKDFKIYMAYVDYGMDGEKFYK